MSLAGGALIAMIAGLFLREAGAVRLLLGILLTSASLALLAALFAAFVGRSSFKPAASSI